MHAEFGCVWRLCMQVYYVYSLAQGVAAMQAGASVLQPSVGSTREWYDRNPGAIRDPKVSSARGRAGQGRVQHPAPPIQPSIHPPIHPGHRYMPPSPM